MKKFVRVLIILLVVLSIGGIVYYLTTLFNLNKEYFNNNNNNNNKNEMLNNIKNFSRNEQAISIFKKIKREDAKKYGLSMETYDALHGIFDNNEPPSKLAEIFLKTPEETDILEKLMAQNANE